MDTEKSSQRSIKPDFIRLVMDATSAQASQARIVNKSPNVTKQIVKLSPHLIYQVLQRDLQGDLTAEMAIYEAGEELNTFLSIAGHHEDEEIFNDLRDYDVKGQTVKPGNLSVSEKWQGQGIGRTVLRNQIELFALNGARFFEITAGNENGASSWAKMIPLDEDRLPDFEDELIDTIRLRIDLLESLDVLPLDVISDARDYAMFNASSDLKHLAEMDYDVFEEISSFFDPHNDEITLTRSQAEQVAVEFGEQIRSASRQGEKLPLSRLLLAGTKWPGKLDLQDPGQMRNVEDYAGSFRYLDITP